MNPAREPISPPPRRSRTSLTTRSGSHAGRRPGSRSRELRRSREAIAVPNHTGLLRKVFMVGLFLLAQGLFAFSELFHLHGIHVQGNRTVARNRILARARVEPGTPIWLVSPGALAERVSALHMVKGVQVAVRLPGRVEISVSERESAFVVVSRGVPGRYFSVDREGVLLSPVTLPSNLPILELDEPLVTGGRLSQGVIPIANEALAMLTPILPEPCSRLRIDRMEAVTAQTTCAGAPLTVKLGTLEHREYKKNLLKALVSRLAREKRTPELLDLRYTSPILKLTPAPEIQTP
ncbi:MAG: FtsQ-type POTRA domain-containing protein [Candidatus Eremiobacterota bacterium]